MVVRWIVYIPNNKKVQGLNLLGLSVEFVRSCCACGWSDPNTCSLGYLVFLNLCKFECECLPVCLSVLAPPLTLGQPGKALHFHLIIFSLIQWKSTLLPLKSTCTGLFIEYLVALAGKAMHNFTTMTYLMPFYVLRHQSGQLYFKNTILFLLFSHFFLISANHVIHNQVY